MLASYRGKRFRIIDSEFDSKSSGFEPKKQVDHTCGNGSTNGQPRLRDKLSLLVRRYPASVSAWKNQGLPARCYLLSVAFVRRAAALLSSNVWTGSGESEAESALFVSAP
jgi:hypothetical protein